MKGRRNLVVLAMSLTTLDAWVLHRYGLVAWQALGEIIWIRMTLLLLASVWAYSLIDVWGHALAGDPELGDGGESRLPDAIATLSRELAEGSDV